MFQQRQGISSLLKDGANHYSGVDEAVLKNIQACRQLAKITQTSLGPYGLNKLITNHLGKQFITSDSAVMMQELEVMHPAAKMMVIAAEAQEAECGDMTNFVISFIGELLKQAESLLKQGIHLADVIRGYELAYDKLMEKLPSNVCWSLVDPYNFEQLQKSCKSVISSKLYGYEDQLSKLVAEAALMVMPKDPRKFDIQNIRVGKITGAGFSQSQVLSGLVSAQPLISTIQKVENCKVAVYPEGIAVETMETKGTVLLKTAEQLMNYTKGEEESLEDFVKELKNLDIKLVVCGGPMSDIAIHYFNKYKIGILKLSSKFEVQRICKVSKAVALCRLGVPTAEEIGFFNEVYVEEIASHKVTVMKTEASKIATILLRSSTKSLLEEMERAIADSCHVIQNACIDGRYVSGGGATEIEMAREITKFGNTLPGMDQYAVNAFADALEVIPKMLAMTCGQNIISTIGALYSSHECQKENESSKHYGVNVDFNQKSAGKQSNNEIVTPLSKVTLPVSVAENQNVIDCNKAGILDHFMTKYWAFQHSVDAAITILRVDQIIIARQAGQ